eukprot:3518431-Rhodomonas_salina.1
MAKCLGNSLIQHGGMECSPSPGSGSGSRPGLSHSGANSDRDSDSGVGAALTRSLRLLVMP